MNTPKAVAVEAAAFKLFDELDDKLFALTMQQVDANDIADVLTDLREAVDALRAELARPLVAPVGDAKFQAHTEAVAEFLSELYGIMVGPCAVETMSVKQMQAALITAALRDRELAATRHQEVVRAEPVAEVLAEGDTIRLKHRLPMGTKLYTAPAGTVPLSSLPELTCSHSNRSDCALFDTGKRPSKEWYAAKIAETDGLDSILPSGALAATRPPVAEQGQNPVHTVNAESGGVQGAEPVCFDGFLCRAWGESDKPCAEVVSDPAGISRFMVREWLGDEDATDADGTPTLQRIMYELKNRDWGEDGEWLAEFEIGGVSVEPVYSFAAPAEAQGNAVQDGKDARMVSVGYQYLFASPFGGDVWRDSADEWNGNKPKDSRAIFAAPSRKATTPHVVHPRDDEAQYRNDCTAS